MIQPSDVADKPMEILLVEDNPGDIRLTQAALAAARISSNLHVVTDGEAAIRFLTEEGAAGQATRPQFIILDLNLPKKNGYEVLQTLKNSDQGLRRIPVLVLTSSKRREDINSSYELHANCYVTKPRNIRNLIAVMERIKEFWFSTVMLPN